MKLPIRIGAERSGKKLTCYQNVTLGAMNGNVLTVCDDVTLYPNSVVNKNVRCGTTVVGASAKEIKQSAQICADQYKSKK